MAAVFESISSVSDTSFDGTIVVSKPSGTADGDVLLALVEWYDNSISLNSVPSGWTQVGTTIDDASRNYHGAVFQKPASSEGASWSWGFSGNTVGNIAVLRFSSADTPTGNGQLNSSSSSAPGPGFEVVAGGVAVYFVAHRDGISFAVSTPSGYTNRLSQEESFGGGYIKVATKDQGSTATETPSGTMGGSTSTAGFTINVPGSGPPPTPANVTPVMAGQMSVIN